MAAPGELQGISDLRHFRTRFTAWSNSCVMINNMSGEPLALPELITKEADAGGDTAVDRGSPIRGFSLWVSECASR